MVLYSAYFYSYITNMIINNKEKGIMEKHHGEAIEQAIANFKKNNPENNLLKNDLDLKIKDGSLTASIKFLEQWYGLECPITKEEFHSPNNTVRGIVEALSKEVDKAMFKMAEAGIRIEEHIRSAGLADYAKINFDIYHGIELKIKDHEVRRVNIADHSTDILVSIVMAQVWSCRLEYLKKEQVNVEKA